MTAAIATPLTTSKNDRLLPQLISFPLNLLTLEDVMLDSPIFLTNLEQVTEQSVRFERWLEEFVHGLKVYMDSLSKTNVYTAQLYKLLALDEKDATFMFYSQIASREITGITDSLKCRLSAKVKLANNLYKTLVQLLQDFLKLDIKEFKDMRRTFEKTIDKYEHHLARYNNVSKSKEPSALREDAFQMFDNERSYARASGTYFLQKLDNQALFDAIHCTTIRKIRPESPTSKDIAITTSNAAVTALTVQAQARLTTDPQVAFEHGSSIDFHSSSPLSGLLSLSNSDRFSTAKVLMEQQHHSTSLAAGALNAAIKAANEARIVKSKTRPTRIPCSKPKRVKDTMITINSSPAINRRTIQINDKDNISSSITTIATKLPPTKPAVCGCEDHLDKIQADLKLPISAKALFDFMSGMSCWNRLTKAKGNTAPSASKWKRNDTGLMERTLNYTMPNPMGKSSYRLVKMKDAEVIDTHQVLKQEEGLCYVMLITTKVPMLPYADSFIPMMKLCITYNTPTTCRLVCNIGVKWLKSVMMKGMINRAALKGMRETVSALTLIAEQSATQGKHATLEGSKKRQRQHNATKDGMEEQRGFNSMSPTLDQQGLVGSTKQEGNTMESNILISATILSPQRLIIFVCVALLLLFYTTRPRSPFNFTLSHSPACNLSITDLSWRAVHLVDMESFIRGKNTEVERFNTSTYQAFKKSRSDIGEWNYHWLNMRHRLIAAELSFKRERLAVIRYELMTAFNMLNGMDQQLLQSEYWTWLLDQRTRCDTVALDTMEQQSDSSHNHLALCNEIKKALNDCMWGHRS